MDDVEESAWSEIVHLAQDGAATRRFVKRVICPGTRTVVQVDVIAESALGPPPEDTFADAFYDWLTLHAET